MALQKTLLTLSEKLGLHEVALKKKAEELLLTYKSKASLKNLNDNALGVMCLDLASKLLGIYFDKESAIKVSGLKKIQYQNYFHNIEKILNLDRPLTIPELCVQFSCTVAKETAEKILSKYKEKNSVADYNHPQYAAAAVFVACKLKKIKAPKPQFISISRLKPSQFKELEADFDKFAESIGVNVDVKSKQKNNGNDFHNYLEQVANVTDNVAIKSTKELKDDDKVEDYEVWKKRILEEAREALKNK